MGQVAKIIQQIQNGPYQAEAILQATESSLCSAENNKPDPLALAKTAGGIIDSTEREGAKNDQYKRYPGQDRPV